MEQSNNTLPAEVVKTIKERADEVNLELDRKIKPGVTEESRHHFLVGHIEGFVLGATEWAQWKVKYDELQADNESLRRWEMEAAELLAKIYSYAHKHLEIKLGECTVDFIIARSKERDELKDRCEKIETALKQFISYHETGLLPDRGTYEKGVEAMKGEVTNQQNKT